MFNKILVANRGAIACRIIRTLKKMNIESVAIYAESDRDSSHINAADLALCLGSGPAKDTYLNQEKIIQLARENNVDAIHPGYGFLSENVSFVEACKKNQLVFIGPTARNMEAFALKHNARSLARQHDVPLVPGSPLLQDSQHALREATRIGYPVILKSSAGGGGIGMEICYEEDDILSAFDSVVHLSQNNFSDSRVFLEKYIEHARHIEVQVFGNGCGISIDLGDRDCSLQRRNQKIIEEAPAPNLASAVRTTLRETATRLLSAINYESAGTVEFIYDTRDEQFYFLEVNTRLQVEHGVTELIYNVDIVQWMVEQAHSPIRNLEERREKLHPQGHAVQARVYAENPAKNFQPCAGLLSHVHWSDAQSAQLRLDTWISSGAEVSPFFDPLLAKVIVSADSREQAINSLTHCLSHSEIYGIETNLHYLASLTKDQNFLQVRAFTRYLNTWTFDAALIEVISPGTMTTIQDLPGRLGYWEVGVPPSGPFDSLSFHIGNQLLDNDSDCAGLEITMQGPTLTFFHDTHVVITGAEVPVFLDDQAKATWEIIAIKKNQTLRIGATGACGSRAYLLVKGGIQCPNYLGSQSTFTLGRFGGHAGRTLQSGDCLRIKPAAGSATQIRHIPAAMRPIIGNDWTLHVIYGPHGADDFFTESDIDTFFKAEWEVHYNSSRTGIRLIGPQPEWARKSGGEAGMHPSNIHDNAYALGTVDFTGDMPVILGPDGPSLGGFVCPATVISADRWKLGQMCAGDKIRFVSVSVESAIDFNERVNKTGMYQDNLDALVPEAPESCILKSVDINALPIVIRPAGDRFILVEFGEQVLDLRLRFHVYALREQLLPSLDHGLIDLTPGIRSLQIHFNPQKISHRALIAIIEEKLTTISHQDDVRVESRIVHLPLSWDDTACHEAVEKYQRSVRTHAPWCPDNIEFIRRINGLSSVDAVKDIVFSARYVVMGLGDVYLGAPVATPLDPRHRLVTTKYNPARTWTAENSVGIGGAYLCIYGMEGPGGYQFVGRTLQMWNRYKKTRAFSQPWLLRFFDQIRFYEVSHDELTLIRHQFPNGDYPITIEYEDFSLRQYESFLEEHVEDITAFEMKRRSAFDIELQHWRDTGQFHFESSQKISEQKQSMPEDIDTIDSTITGSVWKLLVQEGEIIQRGQPVAVLESMKMEIEIISTHTGTVHHILGKPGDLVRAGQALISLRKR